MLAFLSDNGLLPMHRVIGILPLNTVYMLRCMFLFQGLVAGGRLPWLFSTSDLCNVAAMLNDPRINPTGMKEAWVGGKRKDFDSDTAFYWHHVKGMKTMLV